MDRDTTTTWNQYFYGPNAGYAAELYERYLENPGSVDPATRRFFDTIGATTPGNGGQTPNGSQLGACATRSTTGGNGARTQGAVEGGSELPTDRTATAVATRPQTRATATGLDRDTTLKIVAAARLARGIREYGHLAADIDPLGAARPGDPMIEPATHRLTNDDLAALPPSIVWPAAGPEVGTCLDAINRLREIYCGPIGYEFDHVQDWDERTWLHQMVEAGTFRARLSADDRRALLYRLTEVEGFERFLHTKFLGQKRFSIEGDDALVPMLDRLIHDAAETGMREIVVGMSHRGRLNVLAHVLGKPYGMIFSEFHATTTKDEPHTQSSSAVSYGWTGDVKYHLGARTKVNAVAEVQITLIDNPSHLEFVNPVAEGSTRAAQDVRKEAGAPPQDVDRALAIAIHGDAAFPGEGIVAETLNLSRLPGYRTGGTINIIVNNQIGFTTEAGASRSTLYASDLAKGYEIPILHVNADEPEACLTAVALAIAYRQRFHKDFLIDLVGYRRWGHNEGDEPSFTQPSLYTQIAHHPTARARYAERLAAEGVVTLDEAQTMVTSVAQQFEHALNAETAAGPQSQPPSENPPPLSTIETAVAAETLRALNDALLVYPDEFHAHSKLERPMSRRREALNRPGSIDWAHAETLAFASILADGTPIRLSGQDSERGTFSQRHLVLHDPQSGAEFTPLQHLPQARASFAVYNSPLSEGAIIGFEYGYSVQASETLVLWEAQFGDFANAGQVFIDQFLAAARAKWRQQPTMVMLLPHGYEGQGPEHSSGRLERYLQLAAEDNIRIANCTTAAQYFHLLRLQAATLANYRRPLVVMTPKSLLRHPRAASSLDDLAVGRFQPVLHDGSLEPEGVKFTSEHVECVERLILCSGKVAVDLATTVAKGAEGAEANRYAQRPWVAVARVELLYPFPQDAIRDVIATYPNLREVAWLQEEPANMGAWTYIAPRLQALLPAEVPLRYIGRPERASTAVGSSDVHMQEQAKIVEAAFDDVFPATIETRGVYDVS